MRLLLLVPPGSHDDSMSWVRSSFGESPLMEGPLETSTFASEVVLEGAYSALSSDPDGSQTLALRTLSRCARQEEALRRAVQAQRTRA